MALGKTSEVPLSPTRGLSAHQDLLWSALGIAILLAAPFFVYPVFLIKLLCMALFACVIS